MSAEHPKPLRLVPADAVETALARASRLARRPISGTIAKVDSRWDDEPAAEEGARPTSPETPRASTARAAAAEPAPPPPEETALPPAAPAAEERSFFLPHPDWTLPDVLDLRAAMTPDAPALHELTLAGTTLRRDALSFAALRSRSLDVAAALAAAGVRHGDRVVVSLARPSSFAAAIVATMRAGAIAVPIPPADGLELPRAIEERVRAVLSDCAPRAVLGDARCLAIVHGLAPELPTLDLAAIPTGARATPNAARLEDVAFLQYTSGSTGAPRGVVVRHANLVANLRAITAGAAFGPDDRCVSWLPLFHDMGLVGALLLGLYLGTEPHLMEPRTFLLRPASWLEAMSTFRATFTVAPNFAYALVAKRLPDAALAGLDLSSMRLFFDGAEPIDRATTDAFTARLAPAGMRAETMYPVYGLAEATLAACFPAPGSGARYDTIDRRALASTGCALPIDPASPDALSVACLGRALPHHRVRVVDSFRGRELTERTVGEIVIDGPSISAGYWGHPLDRRELRTGDLGYLAGGELHVVDRLKDIVIVAGRNHAPSDLERAAATVRGIVPGAIAAFGAETGDGTDALILLAAIHPTTWRTADAMRREIAAAVHERAGIRPSRVLLVGPGDVPRTSSGKIRRSECRRLFEAGALIEVEGLFARAAMKLERMRRRAAAVFGARSAREEVGR